MAVKVKFARPSAGKFLGNRIPGTHIPKDVLEKLLAVLGICLCLVLLVVGITFSYYNHKYTRVVDERLAKPLFVQTARIYAAPQELRTTQKLAAASVAQQLRSAGYSEGGGRNASPLGTFKLTGDTISIRPGPQSYHSEEGATVSFKNGRISSIAGDTGQELGAYDLEPQLITGLSEGANRTKRRLVTFSELPPNLVHAVTSIEDRRFFDHGGVDYIRLVGALRDDLLAGRKREGGSTLTMQLARGFFLTPEKKFKRKLIEIAITFQLEHRFTKQQIFEMYANQINLGQQGSFAINGFGEAARAYFGKDVRQLDLPESALLAGMIQHPSYLNPYRHAKRAIARRNIVLDAMADTGAITPAQAAAARQEPLKLAPGTVDGGEAPYFVDLVRDQLTRTLGTDADYNSQGLRIYTSLDPELQHAANEAVAEGMKIVDAQVERRRARSKDPGSIPSPQVALIALNPHTGQILALVGGRNYGLSQLNHATAKRPTGSIFKPFVYAAAFNTSLAGTVLVTPPPAPVPADVSARQGAFIRQDESAQQAASLPPPPPDPGKQNSVFTALTQLNNDETIFEDGYSPRNFHSTRTGQVTARTALQWSLNNATVELAQMVGYSNVAALARDAGIKSAQGTPAVALGAYDATPIDMAGAYTVFANNGVKIAPWMLASVRSANGDVVSDYTPTSKPILDPRIAYLTTSMMQNVINSGTGYDVRRNGFLAPAAGKTGTSHDAWFAGYTSNLICIVWVGNDDYSDVKLEGAKAAAPMWAAFMKRAILLPQYSDVKDFSPPSGVTIVKIDKQTDLVTDSTCPVGFYAAFLDGTAPTTSCSHAADDQRNFFQKIFGLGGSGHPQIPTAPGTRVVQPPGQPTPPNIAVNTPGAQPPPQEKPKKKGFFGRLFGGGGNKDKQQPQQPAPQQ
ncbi:MAG: transglycosylase domain-containing protein [Acidobacteriaceae bacterium]